MYFPKMPVSLVWWRALFAAMVVIASPALAAAAGSLKVVVLPVTGSDGAVETRMERALRDSCSLVPVSEWDAAATKLFATSKKAEDLAAVATDLGVAVVVTGTVKQEGGGHVLSLSVRHGPTGKKAVRLQYPLASGEVDEATMQKVAREIGPAVQRAAAGPAAADSDDDKPKTTPEGADATEATPEPGAATKRPRAPAAPPAPSDDTPVDTVERPKTEPRAGGGRDTGEAGGWPDGRPPWAPWYEVALGLIASGRNLVITPRATEPFFASTIAEGLHLDGAVYPLAYLSRRPGQAMNAASGLGIGVLFDGVFWPDAVPCTRDMNNTCMPTSERYGVRELRFEVGPRWHFTPLMKRDSAEVLASVQYGQHGLTMQKRADGSDVGPPDTSYSYISLGVGARVPLVHALALAARFHYLALLGQGPINAITEYGSGGGNGLRIAGGIELTLWKGLVARVEGFYERFSLSFDNKMTSDKMATGGLDQYYGTVISMGWVEHRDAVQLAAAPVADTDGDGIPDGQDLCPAEPGPAATRGCPDGDGDGIVDAEDKCPQVPGTAALQGCPDVDGDSVADVDDDCPSVAGEASNRGCPTYKAIKVTAERIELSEKIFFAYDKTEILPKSLGILDEVVKALIDHPTLRVKIFGHTDSSGSEDHNLALSAGRANAVMQYLIAHGVDGTRLESQGFGSQYPIDNNKTQSGRENNRRVEFLIVKESQAK